MFRWSLLILSLSLLSPLAQAADSVISNPADAPVIETWHLNEVWRLDNEENEDLPLMGAVNQGVVTPDGHVLLLDSQMAHVLEISPTGEFLGTLGRMGQGPGELEQTNGLFLADEGQIGLMQMFPGKVVFLNRDGTPGGQVRARGENPMFYRVMEAAGSLVASGRSLNISGGAGDNISDKFLRCYSRDGAPGQPYLESTEVTSYDPPVMNEKGTWFPYRAWTLAPDGSLLVATDRDEYRIDWLEPGGERRRLITREFKPYKRTREDREKVLGSMRMWTQAGEIQPKKTILDTAPAIRGIQVLQDGTIWVRSCYAEQNLPEGVSRRYDVFDERGNLQTEVHIAYPVDPELDFFSLLADGRFLLYLNGRSVLDAVFASVEAGGDEEEEEERDDGEELYFQVVLLERER